MTQNDLLDPSTSNAIWPAVFSSDDVAVLMRYEFTPQTCTSVDYGLAGTYEHRIPCETAGIDHVVVIDTRAVAHYVDGRTVEFSSLPELLRHNGVSSRSFLSLARHRCDGETYEYVRDICRDESLYEAYREFAADSGALNKCMADWWDIFFDATDATWWISRGVYDPTAAWFICEISNGISERVAYETLMKH